MSILTLDFFYFKITKCPLQSTKFDDRQAKGSQDIERFIYPFVQYILPHDL
jgi:hypothetical protein